MRALLRQIARGAGSAALFFLPAPVFAHAFGQSYSLPLPVGLYIGGAGAAVIASFVILSFFSKPDAAVRAGALLSVPRAARSRAAGVIARGFGILALVAAIATGFFGSQEIAKNPALFLFWVALLLIVAYASAIVSGIWERIDPLRAIARALFGGGYEPLLRFPKALRYVPALAFYYWLLWFELLSYGAGAVPSNVAWMLSCYTLLTLVGCALFGAAEWFCWGDFFSVFFRTIGAFAPFSIEESGIRARIPGERLVDMRADSFAFVLFVLLMLSSTSFDGLRDTRPWVRFFVAHPALQNHYQGLLIALLLISPVVFLALYAAAAGIMRAITGERGLVLRFAYALVPIAIAYSVAHYFALVVSEGQNLIPMLSDPFGQGIDLFGTKGYQYNPGLLSAQALWYTQVAAIVLGHIAATYVAHRIAQREFTSRRHVIVSQLPMVALMVVYTGFGLWILSLPYAA